VEGVDAAARAEVVLRNARIPLVEAQPVFASSNGEAAFMDVGHERVLFRAE